jgi:pyruvate dehydrogenase E1 component
MSSVQEPYEGQKTEEEVGGVDRDPQETSEWLQAFEQLRVYHGEERARFIIRQLHQNALHNAVELPELVQTPYLNSIPVDEQAPFPGDERLEKRIRAIIRWNAAVMVHRANKVKGTNVGGHISTYASACTLYEVGFNHFFRSREQGGAGDHIYFQGHASPGIYARAFLEGFLTEENLDNFRQETGGKGLCSYPHPWLMPKMWEYPTVSMGIGPLNAIYQARFNRYMHHRGIKDTSGSRVWAFLGDGECDEPESLGALSIASREKLDNLVFVVNCNLQRLDGPVRGNFKIIQELEAVFRGAGWNVIKVIWGSDWDPLIEADESGLLAKRMGEAVDGEYQKYVVEKGSYTREHFFGRYPETADLVKNLSDEQIQKLRRGGHDPLKVYAAYHWATTQANGKPTAILAKTVKGWGTGELAEGKNVAHNAKYFNSENELKAFRDRLGIPVSDEQLKSPPFYLPKKGSPELDYLHERRKALGGYAPRRVVRAPKEKIPALSVFEENLKGSASKGGKELSTTSAYNAVLGKLIADKAIGKQIVPIIPDEARTFGLETLFGAVGIYSSVDQRYEPVDYALKQYKMHYRESKDGQVLEEGINEAGSLASFTAAGTAYASHGVNMIPFYIYYSMFGYQRVGDLVWAAADSRTKGFLLGATAGRTTLNGEGLQHEDGHSPLLFSAVPTCRIYDPAWAYEVAVVVQDGLKRMYQDQESCFYYLTLYNENYFQPEMPPGVEDGIIQGLYLYKAADPKPGRDRRVQLLGSGVLLKDVLKAQALLAEKYGVAADVWSAPSYVQLRREALACERENFLHPEREEKVPYVVRMLGAADGPIVAVTDYMKALPEMVAKWFPGRFFALGTDGFGRSDTREALRRHFEVDASATAYAALYQLAKAGKFPKKDLAKAMKDLGIDPAKIDPSTA